ncbi:MAG: FkbM family methyltransferase [Bdellovibrionales bacterium]
MLACLNVEGDPSMSFMLLTFAPQELPLALRKLGQGAHVLQIGAMDGVAFDPVHALVRTFGWRGALVEPMPDMFQALQKNYAGCEGLIFINKAVTEYDGEIEMTRIDPQAIADGLLPAGALGISTMMPDRGLIGNTAGRMNAQEAELVERYKRVIRVPCCTMETLLREQKIERVDVLVIDTEGADWMVLRQFPIDRFCPRVVYMEIDHLPQKEKLECFAFLSKAGYQLRVDELRENLLAERNV